MSEFDWPGRADPDLPAATLINVVGTVDKPNAPGDAAIVTDAARFRAWLVKRHPGARVTLRIEAKPTAMGRAWVHYATLLLRAESGGLPPVEQARRISI